MQLSAYLLLLDNPQEVMALFTSEYGRTLLNQALDELIVLQDYCNNKKNVLKETFCTDEVFDIAYSYHCFKKTGECKKHIYASTSNQLDRFGNLNTNFNGDYSFDKTKDIFNPQSVFTAYKALQNGEQVCFPVEEEFNDFVKDWISTSKTLFTTKVSTALGFTPDGEFGYIHKAEIDTLKPHTVRLLKALIDYASYKAVSDGNTSSRVSALIDKLTEIIGLPAKSKTIFNTTYNNLNRDNTNDNTGIRKSQSLRLRYEQIMNSLEDSTKMTSSLSPSQVGKIQDDCRVIFSANYSNTNNSKVNSSNLTEYVNKHVPESIGVDGVFNFLNALLPKDDKDDIINSIVSSSSNSIVSAVKLYTWLCNINTGTINLALDIEPSLTFVELSEASDELYRVFGIPFMSRNPKDDLGLSLLNNYIITAEEYRLDKPIKPLMNFAHVMSYSLYSKVGRYNIKTRS